MKIHVSAAIAAAATLAAAALLVPLPDAPAPSGRLGVVGPVETVSVAAGRFAYAVAGETGAIVPPDDQAAMEAAILSYLADPAYAAVQGQAGRHHVEANFRLEGEAEKLVEIYRQLAAGQGA